ncbi:arginine biosynthesis protein ArgJ [Cephaloticoccus capnophilus]|uniref:Arginine biosynthesis bifunctional protein ArgJ n=1 Tax=Cephaloticoccus capnophilus TaxID=1548208 RepID=A0A139SM24_9BACT|nr:bifunctional ornithine acetyltransferase/N-acetylglutamate synthase [Cephaloticoccus capnophilus]KXU35617.1 arginine biosynthesis protein ArgJ [Cephaloticoccus capnophilus]
MPSTDLVFPSCAAHRRWLAAQAALPRGFRVGTAKFAFTPREAPKPSEMTLTLISLDAPTRDFAAVFTRNAFPGAPVVIGRERLQERELGAIIVNNKISNVCAPEGRAAAEAVCTRVGELLGLPASAVLPSSTGVIGWSLPVEEMLAALPSAKAALQADSILPAAQGIVTTDLYPKVRRHDFANGGSLVGVAKGAGMIEPNLATMLVYLLTDVAVPREALREMLRRVVEPSFNSISIDSDTSTSDTVAVVSSGRVACEDLGAFEEALRVVCCDLAEDVVRNGEGVRHVIRVAVTGASDAGQARSLGKAIINAPLFKCAVAGNDPNVGRLVQAIGKGAETASFGTGGVGAALMERLRLTMGGIEIFSDGVFQLDPQKEATLVAHLKQAELYESRLPADGIYRAGVDYPPHERCVEVGVDLGAGDRTATVLGGDLTHEYVSENADYRS